MEMTYLLDSNVWIKVLQGRENILLDRFSRENLAEMSSCSPVLGELLVGSEKYVNSIKRKVLVEGLLSKFVSFSFDDRCANVYAWIRHDLERRGCVIGPYDLQISAIALAHDLTVVTGNVAEFSRVTGLKIEDWTVE